jgi:radical SAM superfamily enzyme YgiQ (UPF0313 family)
LGKNDQYNEEGQSMKVLIISANTLPASPTGPAYVAGAALRAGHSVEIFECLFAQDLSAELRAHIERFRPDVVGVSIRLVHGYIIDKTAEFNTRHIDLRANVKQIVDTIRQVTDAPIILGGPGFNYYGRDWLEYLDLDFGIRGEADFSFPLYLKLLEEGGDLEVVPGCVYRQDEQILKTPRALVENLEETAFPAYHLFDLERYQQYGISPGILTKRGCAFRCTYCPYRSLEGARYRLKSPARVVDEIEHIQQVFLPKMVMFCENNFNVPKWHAEAICREIVSRKLDVTWGTGDLRPMGITPDFCRLLKESGCNFVNLSVESGSETMLQRMRRGYTVADIQQSFTCLEKAKIPFSASLMIGAPGENPDTVTESLTLIDRQTIPLGTWVTVGICLWTPRQEVLSEARRVGQLVNDSELFKGANYLSPELPKDYMLGLIDTLQSKKEYTVQVNKAYTAYQRNDRTISRN